MKTKNCTCGNPEFGFDCVCNHVKKYPGNIEFACEFCGIYDASQARCNKCEGVIRKLKKKEKEQ